MTTFREQETTAQAAPARKLTLAEILEIFAGGQLPLKFSAYDGSTAGPDDAELGFGPADPARHHVSGHRTRRSGAGPRLRRPATSNSTVCTRVIPYELLKALAEKMDVQAAAGARAGQHRPVDRASSTSSPSHRRRRRRRPAGAASQKACATAGPVTRRPSTTTTTCPTRSTSGFLARR